MRLEARAGDGWVKLVGDWIDRDAGDLTPCWPVDVLKEAIAAAHEEGARVTAHCFGEASLHDFAAAGTDCIEHATGLEPETIAQFAAQGIAIVPTLVNIATFPPIAEPAREKFPAYHRRMLALHRAPLRDRRGRPRRRHPGLRRHRRGRLAARTGWSARGGRASWRGPGCPPTRGAWAPPRWGAREWLGRPGLEEGADADLVVYAADPREDIRALVDPQHIVLRGRTV